MQYYYNIIINYNKTLCFNHYTEIVTDELIQCPGFVSK